MSLQRGPQRLPHPSSSQFGAWGRAMQAPADLKFALGVPAEEQEVKVPRQMLE